MVDAAKARDNNVVGRDMEMIEVADGLDPASSPRCLTARMANFVEDLKSDLFKTGLNKSILTLKLF